MASGRHRRGAGAIGSLAENQVRNRTVYHDLNGICRSILLKLGHINDIMGALI